ncbi:peptide chain release factor N(5)-glutamine methyltransferase [Shimia aestuarii]|uniref:Release factor glutamine methyltransferase n=1 Tax=Shimia aestuarii TaxID=254406 RepID=A0A1I4P6U4_9RHOB|nr:peptide chain release factor N(5)-glutamine methyltransferase [Shimia aestuarii]SFM23528.1 [protein release factor]-glutamine N5-methyltransferase [Shimia aestuarii]
MTLREALAASIARLKDAGIEGAARDARALVAEAAEIKPSMVTLEADMVLADPDALEALVARRVAGEPVSKIIGRRQFWGRDFVVTRDTLDPRPETECLIAAALDLGPVARFADLGTGTGIIAISLLAEWPEATALATDVSGPAIAIAELNAIGQDVRKRLEFYRVRKAGEWLPDGIGMFDMILSNPPYISVQEMAELSREVHDHDPHEALTPGGDGLMPYREIAARAGAHLNAGGHVLVEIGWRQGGDVGAIFKGAGWRDVRVLPDLDGRDRVVSARKR